MQDIHLVSPTQMGTWVDGGIFHPVVPCNWSILNLVGPMEMVESNVSQINNIRCRCSLVKPVLLNMTNPSGLTFFF